MIKVLFFAQVREVLGVAQLEIESPPDTVRSLRQQLSDKGVDWQLQLIENQALVAVNQTMCDDNTGLSDGDEVAFFPPVTGG